MVVFPAPLPFKVIEAITSLPRLFAKFILPPAGALSFFTVKGSPKSFNSLPECVPSLVNTTVKNIVTKFPIFV